ncbi:hypothetical protein IP88_15785 [alpha proteobacterium AAP81b]|nr:hypothetical protein IP88_15785 [alpha proteobacterium AAP81b]
MVTVSLETIGVETGAEMGRFVQLAGSRLKHLAVQRDTATDPDYEAKIAAAQMAIALLTRGIQDLNTAIHAQLDRVTARMRRNAELAQAWERSEATMRERFPDAPPASNPALVIAEAEEANAEALQTLLLLALVTANAVIAGDEDKALLDLLGEAVKMLVEAIVDGALPGSGFFLSVAKTVTEVRGKRQERAEAANAIFADLNRLIAGSRRWCETNDDLVAALQHPVDPTPPPLTMPEESGV